jgi:hypothetical protein
MVYCYNLCLENYFEFKGKDFTIIMDTCLDFVMVDFIKVVVINLVEY